MQLGQIIVTIDCIGNADGVMEHPAIVTKVISDTEVNCAIIVDGAFFNSTMELRLLHESVQPTGKRFRNLI